MAIITKANTFTNGQTADGSQVNTNFDTIYNDYNGNITNANIAAGAAIVGSKLDLSSPGTIGATTPSIGNFSSVVSTGNIYSIPLTSYLASSTVVGWSGTPTGSIYYKRIGNTMLVSYTITGTSNATSTSFTLPYLVSNNTLAVGYAQDNTGTDEASRISMSAAGYVINFYKDVAGSAWTDSGTKTINGQFWYEATA